MERELRGFSLLEAVMASALAFLALTIVVQILVPTWQVAGQTYTRIDLAQLGSLAMRHLTDDLQQSVYAGINFPGSLAPDAMSIQPLMALATDGRQVWADHLVVYFKTAQGELYRREYPPGPPSLGVTIPTNGPAQLSGAELLSLCAPSGARLITRYLYSMSVSNGPPLRLALALQGPVPGHSSPEQYTVSTSLWLRNDTQIPPAPAPGP